MSTKDTNHGLDRGTTYNGLSRGRSCLFEATHEAEERKHQHGEDILEDEHWYTEEEEEEEDEEEDEDHWKHYQHSNLNEHLKRHKISIQTEMRPGVQTGFHEKCEGVRTAKGVERRQENERSVALKSLKEREKILLVRKCPLENERTESKLSDFTNYVPKKWRAKTSL